jgi:hypothetical protein
MCHCITPQALLSGLILRANRGGGLPTREEIEALLGTGCPRGDLFSALERLSPADRSAVREMLASAGIG